MMHRRRLITRSAAGIIMARTTFAFARGSATTPPKTGYAPVNGLNLYYEIHGDGEPRFLLHGGLGSTVMFGEVLTLLAKDRQVIAVDLQGHGHTADIDRPIRYELMADDIATLVKFLGIRKADVMGYSLGGGVALRTAIQHPENIARLVVVSAPCKQNGWYPEVVTSMKKVSGKDAEMMKSSPTYKHTPRLRQSRKTFRC